MFAKIFVLVTILYQQDVLGQGMGELNINLISAEPCDGDKGIASLRIVSLDDGKKGFSADINTDFEFGPDNPFEVRVDKVQNGQIQEGIFRHGGSNACVDFEKLLGDFWIQIMKSSGFPEGCPKPAGKYELRNYPFDSKQVKVDKFFYGRFLMNIIMRKGKEIMMCQKIEFTNTKPGESA